MPPANVCCFAARPQYCNHGTLADAIERGWLRVGCDPSGPPNLKHILQTALVRAFGTPPAALQFEHSRPLLACAVLQGRILGSPPVATSSLQLRRSHTFAHTFAHCLRLF